MSIFDKVIEIYNSEFLCSSCLGRMFSLLGTNTTNKERGDSLLLSLTMDLHQKLLSGEEIDREQAKQNLIILSEKARYLPAKLVLEKEGIKSIWKSEKKDCYLCHNLFFENLEKYAKKAQEKVSDYEFTTFLVGSSPDAIILNKEDKFKVTNHIIEAESFKSHFNREVGKVLSERFEKEPDFHYPDLTIIYTINYESYSINLIIRSLFIYGRYKKLIRGIPQTRWPCGKCNGNGCEACDFTGKQYETSVEELICQEFVKVSQAEGSKFHGAGREDIDVRMLGSGRPFILELINPKIRTLDLTQIKQKVNSKNEGKVEMHDLRYSDKNEVIKIKEEAENTQKTYRALVRGEEEIQQSEFDQKLKLIKQQIEEEILEQRTPHRVSHRRADKVRNKKIYEIEGTFLQPDLFEFLIKSQGGTYIKELFTGDQGRTSPSLAEIFGFALLCEQLDVVNINS